MTTVDAEVQFSLRLQRRLLELLGVAWDDISGLMITKDTDTRQIRLDVVKFGAPTQHYIIGTHESD